MVKVRDIQSICYPNYSTGVEKHLFPAIVALCNGTSILIDVAALKRLFHFLFYPPIELSNIHIELNNIGPNGPEPIHHLINNFLY